MTAGKWALLAVAILAAITAALSTLPYGWAHITATAISAAITAWSAAAVTIIHMDGKGNS